jgi:hypothetical protein
VTRSAELKGVARRFPRLRAILGAAIGALLLSLAPARDLSAPVAPLDTVVVTAKRIGVSDAAVTRQVETALQANPYLYDGHITVTVKDGVVTLRGMVLDEWDLRMAIRVSRKIAGVKRVVDDLEMELGGSD